MDSTHQSDHDLLIEIATTVKAMSKTLDGNGKTGLVERVALLETKQASQQSNNAALIWRAMVVGAGSILAAGASAAAIYAAVK
jgi:hypothetical protein